MSLSSGNKFEDFWIGPRYPRCWVLGTGFPTSTEWLLCDFSNSSTDANKMTNLNKIWKYSDQNCRLCQSFRNQIGKVLTSLACSPNGVLHDGENRSGLSSIGGKCDHPKVWYGMDSKSKTQNGVSYLRALYLLVNLRCSYSVDASYRCCRMDLRPNFPTRSKSLTSRAQ